MKSKYKLSHHKSSINKTFLVVIVSTVIFGLLFIYNVSSVIAQERFGNSFYYLRNQIISGLFGFLGLYLAYKIPINSIIKLNKIIWITTLVLLGLVFFSSTTYGANRWIYLGSFSFQPSEFSKISLILILSTVAVIKKTHWVFQYWSILLITGGLILIQPDLDTTIVLIAIGLSIYFLAENNYKRVLGLLGLGVVFLITAILTSSYRRQRLITLLSNRSDTEHAYHSWQSILAIGTGGLFGQGLGMSRFKYGYIPEAVGDSIFAIVAEELGFIGTTIIVLLFLFIVLKIYKIAQNTDNLLHKYMATAIATWIGLQAFVNIGGMIRLFPLAGITLPLISYGGTSLISVLIALGWVLQIERDSKK